MKVPVFCDSIKPLRLLFIRLSSFLLRIRGGHTNNKIRVSTTETRSISDDLDILVAFDRETVDLNYKELHDKGIVTDSKFNPKKPEDTNAKMWQFHYEIAADLNIPDEKHGGCGCYLCSA